MAFHWTDLGKPEFCSSFAALPLKGRIITNDRPETMIRL
jgi:hypothetical protein